MRRALTKFLSAQNNALKTSVPGPRTLTGGSIESAVIVAKRADGPDPPLGSGPLLLDATSFLPPSSPLTSVWFGRVPPAKWTKDVSVLVEGD